MSLSWKVREFGDGKYKRKQHAEGYSLQSIRRGREREREKMTEREMTERDSDRDRER